MLQACSIVLVRSLFGGNVGATARAIKNTGLGPLCLVDPQFEQDDEAVKFSHGAEEILGAARLFSTLSDAVRDCEQVVGFTARERHRRRIRTLRHFAQQWVRDAMENSGAPRTALVFGSERDGLSNRELDRCTELVWIPAHHSHPSYNLAQAVLLCGYELLCAQIEMDDSMPQLHPRRTRPPRPYKLADGEQIEALLTHLRSAFLAIGYARPHTVESLVRSYHEIFSRARLHRREAKMLRGLAHQMLWAARQIGFDGASSAQSEGDDES